MESIEGIEFFEGSLTGKNYKCNIDFDFTIALPVFKAEKFALLIEHDGINYSNVKSLLQLAKEGYAPYTVCIGVKPGYLTLPNGEKRDMRMNSYDLFDSEYGDFIVYELIPYIAYKYKIQFSESPDLHSLSGGSSGGISSFVIAWFHSDYFHRVYMSSPSFLAMGKGNDVPYLIRKYETKPLKIYEEISENEPNDYFGASYPVCLETKMALEFANYDFTCKYFPNEGHCSRYYDDKEAYERNKWLWKDYSVKKITPTKNSSRIEKIIPNNSRWEICKTFPKKESPEIFPKHKYQSAVYSSDKQLIYTANQNDDIIFAYCSPDTKPLTHAVLHTVSGFYPKGAIDIAVDKTDRLYVLTSIGIQCVRSYGLIDAILELPEGKPLKIAVTDALYVQTDKGIFKRKLNDEIVNSEIRKFTSYYD